jgi:hypothetical protein
MSGQLEALVKWERCVNLMMDATRRLPKTLRPTLGRRLDDASIEALVALSDARYLPREARGAALRRVDGQLATIRALLRLTRSRDGVSLGQYRHLSELIDEVGRMIGGLRRGIAGSSEDPDPAYFSSDSSRGSDSRGSDEA